MSVLLALNVLLAVNLAIVWSLGNDVTAGDDCLWSNMEDGGGSSKDGLGRQRLLQMLLRAEGDRLRRRRRQQQQLLPYSPDGHFDWSSTNGDSSSLFEATPTGQLQRHLSLELATLLRRLCGPSSAKPTTITDDEGGISAADDMYRHLSKFPRYGGLEGGERLREAEEAEEEEDELRKPEKRKRPTKTSELDPTFMLMGIGRK